jgi:hypothetical protein
MLRGLQHEGRPAGLGTLATAGKGSPWALPLAAQGGAFLRGTPMLLFRRERPRLTGVCGFTGNGAATMLPHTMDPPARIPPRTIKRLELHAGDRCEFEVDARGWARKVVCYLRNAR